MELEAILTALCAELPDALGIVLADADGESIVTVRGPAPLPSGTEAEVRRHLPRALESTIALDVFALRLAGAEPSPVLRALAERARSAGAGPLVAYEVRYRAVEVLVSAVDEELYVALFLRRPAQLDRARARLRHARASLVRSL